MKKKILIGIIIVSTIILIAYGAIYIKRQINIKNENNEIKKTCPNSKVENEKNIVFKSYNEELVTPLSEIKEWIKTI